MKNRKGNLLMTLGLVLILAALALVGYNQWDASRAQQESDDAGADSHSAADGIAANRCTARNHRDDDADRHTRDGCADNRRADGGCHCSGSPGSIHALRN